MEGCERRLSEVKGSFWVEERQRKKRRSWGGGGCRRCWWVRAGVNGRVERKSGGIVGVLLLSVGISSGKDSEEMER